MERGCGGWVGDQDTAWVDGAADNGGRRRNVLFFASHFFPKNRYLWKKCFFHLGVSVDPSFEAPGRPQPPFRDHFGTPNRIFLDEKTISAKTSIFALLGDQFLQKK